MIEVSIYYSILSFKAFTPFIVPTTSRMKCTYIIITVMGKNNYFYLFKCFVVKETRNKM